MSFSTGKTGFSFLFQSPFLVERAISASIEGGAVSVVAASSFFSGFRVNAHKRYVIEGGGYPSPEEVASRVELFRKEHGAAKSPVTLCLPKAWVVLRTHEYPASAGGNLREAVSYGLDGLTPFKTEEAFFGLDVLERSGGNLKVVISAARRAMVEKYIEALEAEGLEVGRLTFDFSSMESLFGYASGSAAPRRKYDESSRSLLGGLDIERIFGVPADLAVSLGGAVEALRPQAGGIDMLDKKDEKAAKRPLGLTAALAGSFLLLLAVYFFVPLRTEAKRLEAMKGEAVTMKGDVREAERLKKEALRLSGEMRAIEGFKGDGGYAAIVLLKELTSVLPKNTWLTRMNVSEESVFMEGYSASATELLKRLEGSFYFESAEFSSPTLRDTRLGLDKFGIRVRKERASDGRK